MGALMMLMIKHTLRASLLAAAFFPAIANAQDGEAFPAEEEALPAPPADEADPSAEEGNEIVITATKREQSLQNVPVAVSVTTGEVIERAAVRDLKDLQTLVPSLRVSQLQSSANTNFVIRGFGNGANNPGIEPSVGVFVDGVYRSRTAAQIGDLPDVKRIEVLRGPQSTLFGKNASAGVISIVTKQPAYVFHGTLEASYGNYDAKVLKAYVTGPISDTIAASLAGGINRRDGYVTDLGYGGKAASRNRWFLRGQMLFEPNDSLKVRLIGDYDKIDEVCCSVVNLRRSAATGAIEALGGRVNDDSAPFADVTWSNFPSSNKIANWGLSGQVDYEVGPVKVTSITGWRSSRSQTNQDSDFTSADLIGSNRGDVDLETLTQELRINAGFMDIVNLMLGGYYFDENVRYENALTYGTQFRPYADLLSGGRIATLESAILGVPVGTFQRPGVGIFDDFAMDNTAWSVFGNLDLKPGRKLTLTLGGNYTRDSKDVTSNTISTDAFSALDLAAIGNAINPAANPLLLLLPLQLLPPFLNIPNAVESGTTRDGKFTWTARAAYALGDKVNLYASYATGFKASSFNLSRDSRPTAANLPALRTAGLGLTNLTAGSRFAGPESAKVYELGVKANWGLASANLTLFSQSISGFQSNVFTGTGFTLTNAGKQTSRGIEFDGMVKPHAGLMLTMSVVYLDAKYDSFVNSALGDASGRKLGGTPALATTMGVQWSRELAGGDRFTLRGDWHYESPVQVIEGLPGFIQRDSLGQVISYDPALAAARPLRREVSEVSASASYAMTNGLELSVWGRNLTNNRYLISAFDSVAQAGSVSGYTNQPRTYGIAARFKW